MCKYYIDLDRENLFKKIKKIMDESKYLHLTDEQMYFLVDKHIEAMKEQGYTED